MKVAFIFPCPSLPPGRVLEEVAGVVIGGGVFDIETLVDETLTDEGSLVGALSLLSYYVKTLIVLQGSLVLVKP